MIVDSQEKFEKAIATAMDATSEIYESMSLYLKNAEYWMKTTILGSPLYSEADSFTQDLLTQAELIVSLRAFIEGIPFIDLVLTPNGFGIVSNTNLAPASKDRVDRLQKQAQNVLDDAVDTFIGLLNKSVFREKWSEGECFKSLTNSLIWTAEPLRLYGGKPNCHRTQFLELRPHIYRAEQIIASYISRDYLKSLVGKMQTDTITGEEKLIIGLLYQIIGYLIQDMFSNGIKELGFLVNLMENNPEKFPEYINSQEYKLKHTPAYENKKEDSVYFFG